MITPKHIRSPYREATLRSRSRARRYVVEVRILASGAWRLALNCGHVVVRPIQYRVTDRTRLPAPQHIYCAECPPRRQVPGEHEAQIAEFDRKLARGSPK